MNAAQIKQRLQQMGASPKKSLGQNFLVSEHVVEKIISSIKNQNFEHLIEIGPGLGSLTECLIPLAENCLTLIELDKEFSLYWRNRGFRLIEDDALRIDWKSLILEGKINWLVSNLPYQISASLVVDRSFDVCPLDGMILMFQKEVAQRIMAPPKDEHYGLLSVIAQTYWEMEKVVDAGPGAFLPPPKVSSRVLIFSRIKNPVVPPSLAYLKFLKTCFSQRRKKLINNLKKMPLWTDENSKKVKEFFETHDLSESARAEELDFLTFSKLFFHLYPQ